MQHVTPPAKVTSPWAIASLMCSLVVVCPLATLLGPLIGLKAIAEIRARPGLKGTPLALAGIAIGLAVTIMWVGSLFWLNSSVRQPIVRGPVNELQAGFRGDPTGFKAGFVGSGAEMPDEHAVTFINELTRRYGPFRAMEINENAVLDPDASEIQDYLVSYVMTFDRAVVEAQAAFVPFEDMRPVGKWRWIVIKDDELGDFAYPPDFRP